MINSQTPVILQYFIAIMYTTLLILSFLRVLPYLFLCKRKPSTTSLDANKASESDFLIVASEEKRLSTNYFEDGTSRTKKNI